MDCVYQDLLSSLEKLSSCIEDNCEMACKADIVNTDDVEAVKHRIRQNKVRFIKRNSHNFVNKMIMIDIV